MRKYIVLELVCVLGFNSFGTGIDASNTVGYYCFRDGL